MDSIIVDSGVDLKLSVGDTLFTPKWHYILRLRRLSLEVCHQW